MRKSESLRFDHLWHEAMEITYPQLQKATEQLHGAVAFFRRQAYRFAKLILQMNQEYHNELLRMVKSQGMDLTAWMDHHFELIESLEGPRETLFRAIENGTSERQYVAEGTITIIRQRVKPKRAPREERPIPQVQSEGKTPEELLEHLREVNEALVARVQLEMAWRKETERQLKEAQRDRAIVLRRLESVESLLRRSRELPELLKDDGPKESEPLATEMLTANQVAEELGCWPESVHRWRRKGLIPFEKSGKARYRYDLSSVRAALREAESRTASP